MGLRRPTVEERHDEWTVVLVLVLLYAAFFLAALAVAVVFLDPPTCRRVVVDVVPCRLPSLYISWAVIASLFAPALCRVRALLPPLTPAAARLAFRRVGCPLYALVGLLHYFAVTATGVDGARRYVVACTGAATVSFAGLLVFCACLVRECRREVDELGSGYHVLGASDDNV